MAEEQFEETRPISIPKPTPPVAVENDPAPKKRRGRRWLWVLAGLLALLALAGGGAYAGYRSGIQARLAVQDDQRSQNCQEQFGLGVQDLEEKRYDVARQRFEFVIQLCPAFPGVTEMLAETLLALNTTATPTPVPTPTLTPTPDLRGAEELFNQARAMLAEANWSAALETLDNLRKKQPDYQPIDVDGMYYVALRNRGIEKIKAGNLEGGTLDLARAERFGPMDTEAQGWRTWANLYTTGASFWEINWPQAIFYFGQLAPVAPNLRDLSGWTATQRLIDALIGYGDQLAQSGDFCNAQVQYEQALAYGEDPQLAPTATEAAQACFTPTPRPQPTETLVPFPTDLVTVVPPPVTTEPPPQPTPLPTETPTPTS